MSAGACAPQSLVFGYERGPAAAGCHPPERSQPIDTEQVINLDRKTRVVRSGPRLAIQRLQPNGDWDMVTAMQGGSRAIAQWCTANDVYPSRAAEALLASIPEVGFKDR